MVPSIPKPRRVMCADTKGFCEASEVTIHVEEACEHLVLGYDSFTTIPSTPGSISLAPDGIISDSLVGLPLI
jgi:hypothetical protein